MRLGRTESTPYCASFGDCVSLFNEKTSHSSLGLAAEQKGNCQDPGRRSPATGKSASSCQRVALPGNTADQSCVPDPKRNGAISAHENSKESLFWRLIALIFRECLSLPLRN